MSNWEGNHNQRLSDNGSQQKHNALIIYSYFANLGWTKQAVAGMLGNMQGESSINPDVWQGYSDPAQMPPAYVGKGYGLTQWTPAYGYGTQDSPYKMIPWAIQNNLDYTDGDVQLEYIKLEWQGLDTWNVQWSSRLAGMSFMTYSKQTRTPEEMGKIFYWGYERSQAGDPGNRPARARVWYDFLNGSTEPNPPPPNPGEGFKTIFGYSHGEPVPANTPITYWIRWNAIANTQEVGVIDNIDPNALEYIGSDPEGTSIAPNTWQWSGLPVDGQVAIYCMVKNYTQISNTATITFYGESILPIVVNDTRPVGEQEPGARSIPIWMLFKGGSKVCSRRFHIHR